MKRVNMLSKETGEVLGTFKSIKDCAKFVGVNCRGISKVLSGYYLSYGGYNYVYEGQPIGENNYRFIYSLSDPNKGELKYIGCTRHVTKRLEEHRKECRKIRNRDSKKNVWLRTLYDNGMNPKVEILDEVLEDQKNFWEEHYISLYRSWGFDLVNSTLGGVGTKGYSLTWEEKQRSVFNRYGKLIGNRKRKLALKEQGLPNPRHVVIELLDGESFEVIQVFSSIVECAKAIGGRVGGIEDCFSGRQNKHRGYRFRRAA